MDLLRPPGACAAPATTLLVMLPGAYSRPAEFVDEGFVAALRRHGIAADVLVADSHLGYFEDRSVMQRLRSDVVLSARAAGYRRIWLVGISLGGFAALGYALRHGGDIDGVLALAPYLGPRRLMQEIGNAGGPQRWHTSRAPYGSEDLDREIWDRFAGGALPAPPIYMGYGRDDRFADAHRVFATLLPADRVSTAAGGHDWPAWRELWSDWLARGLLPTDCAAGAAA